MRINHAVINKKCETIYIETQEKLMDKRQFLKRLGVFGTLGVAATTARSASAQTSSNIETYDVVYTPGFYGGVVRRTLQSKLDEGVSVFDYMTEDQQQHVLNRTEERDVSDAIELSDAINEAFDNNRHVHFPEGLYITFGLAPSRDQIITGCGIETVIKSINTSGVDLMATPAAPAGESTDGFTMKDIRLQGPGKSSGSGHGLLIEDTTRWYLENVYIDGHGGDALKVKDNTWIGCANRCFFLNSGGDGVELQMLEAGSSNFAIDFISCNSSGNSGYGYHLNPHSVADGNVVNIIGGTIEQNNIGIYCERTRALLVQGVYFEGSTTTKIKVTGQASLGCVTILSMGGGGSSSLSDIIIDSGQVVMDGSVFFEDGQVMDISTDGNVDIKNFILLPDTQTDPCYIQERKLRNRGINGLGNMLRNGNFVPWFTEQTRPSYWSALSTATYARSTPPSRSSGSAVQITCGDATSGLQQTISDLTANNVVTLSSLVMATSGGTAQLRIYDNGEGQQRVLNITATDWRRYTIQHKLSTGSTAVTIELRGLASSDVAFFSEVQVTMTSNLKGFLFNELDLLENLFPDPTTN